MNEVVLFCLIYTVHCQFKCQNPICDTFEITHVQDQLIAHPHWEKNPPKNWNKTFFIDEITVIAPKDQCTVHISIHFHALQYSYNKYLESIKNTL